MKKRIILPILATLILLSISAFKPLKSSLQDDPNVGIYIDNVRVNEITCYSFKKLTMVLPYNSEFNNYDKFQVSFMAEGSNTYVYGIVSKISLKSKNLKGKYFVYDVFIESSELVNFEKDPGFEVYEKRGALAFYQGKLIEQAIFSLEGLSIKGYKETYEEGCQCVKKEPEYSYERLAETKIALKNRTKKGVYSEPAGMKVDMSQPCSPSGTKVDFNNLK